MKTQAPPLYTLPTPTQQHRTLLTVKRSGLALAVFFLMAGGWRLQTNQVQANTLKQRNAESLTRSVITARTKPGASSQQLVLPASLRGNSETQIFARTNGYLSAWHKTIGDQVKKGDLLAVIDVPELEQELAQAHAAAGQIKVRLELARSTLKRWTLLKESDSAIQQEFDEKRSALLQAEADLAAAEVNIRRLEKVEGYRRIVAPFSGVITRRSVDVGSLVSSGSQELFALTQTDPLRLTVWAPQVYADDIKPGQEVSIRHPESRDKNVIAHVEHVAGALDPVSRSRQIDISLPNASGKFLPGAYVEASIKITGKTSLQVAPVNVLVVDQAGSHVVVVDADSRIRFRPVTLGRDFGREIEILEGVGPDDLLVASPSDLLEEGEKVSVAPPAEKSKDKPKG